MPATRRPPLEPSLDQLCHDLGNNVRNHFTPSHIVRRRDPLSTIIFKRAAP